MAGWHLGIGDPTPLGWVATLAYGFSAILCWGASRRGITHAQTIFWILVAAIMLLLGINKQLDFQSLLVVEGRKMALEQGWFEARREIQAMFVLVAGTAGLMLCLLLGRRSRLGGRATKICLSGLSLIAVFVFLRAALFNHFPLPHLLFRLAQSGAEFLELAGLAVIASAAALFEVRQKK